MTKQEATEARLAKIVRLGTRTQAINASERLAAMRRVSLPTGYTLQDSGDPLAPWEVIDPTGRTVTIAETRLEGVEIANADERERQ